MIENDRTEHTHTDTTPAQPDDGVDRTVASVVDLARRLHEADQRNAALQHRLDTSDTAKHITLLICGTVVVLAWVALIAITSVVGA